MSIAVRVSVWILGVLVVISAAVAVMALMQGQTLQAKNRNLSSTIADDQNRLTDLNNKATQLSAQVTQLQSQVSQTQQDKQQIQSQYDDLKQKSDALQTQLQQASSDRDDWKGRVSTITQERDALLEKLKNQPVKIVYKDRIVQPPASSAAGDNGLPAAGATPDLANGQNDQYWASILKQKAALQIEVDKEKSALDQAALQVADLKKQNSDLTLQVEQINNEKDEVIQKIKYGQDLADNLSIDLARSRNDQAAVSERAQKVKQENLQLLSQVRELNSTKVELENTISRLTDEKADIQKKLVETESVIQSRIDDIWKIKQSLDKKLAENGGASSAGGMELPPIIVNGPNTNQPPTVSGKTEGTVISINESNNFVVVDLGQQNSAVSVGGDLKVYRGQDQIASLQIIQVRRDICAADIKQTSTPLMVGDVVRFN